MNGDYHPQDSSPPSRIGVRGQSEVLGVVLLLGFTIAVAGMMVVVGSAALDTHQQATESANAENELSLLGSRISQVGLGDSDVQTVSFGTSNGEYEVQENEGRMKIEHLNRTAGSVETIDNISLGAVVYTNGDTQRVYQGGGVWSQTDGTTQMISPPEFHYRSGTLTLPIINILGDSSVTGSATADITPASETTKIYPNSARTYPDNTTFRNPIDNGTIRVTVDGAYAEGWYQYFTERTEGDASYDEATQTASVDLTTLGDQGETELRNGGSISLRGVSETEPLNDFTLDLEGDGSSGLNNMGWSLLLEEEEFIYLHENSGSLDVTITDSDGVEWHADNAFNIEEDPDRVHVNLTSTDINVTDGTEEKTLYEVFNDRVAAHGPHLDLVVEDSNGSQRVDHENSHAFIEYREGGYYITYLQVTENTVDIELN